MGSWNKWHWREVALGYDVGRMGYGTDETDETDGNGRNETDGIWEQLARDSAPLPFSLTRESRTRNPKRCRLGTRQRPSHPRYAPQAPREAIPCPCLRQRKRDRIQSDRTSTQRTSQLSTPSRLALGVPRRNHGAGVRFVGQVFNLSYDGVRRTSLTTWASSTPVSPTCSPRKR